MTNEIHKNFLKQDSINIKGLVEIQNGDTLIKTENKFVQSMLVWIANMCSLKNVTTNYSIADWNLGTYLWDIYLGTDQNTPTLYDRTVLVSPIGPSPGTAATTKSGSTQNPSSGVFKVMYTANWPTNTVSGTVGEMALYLSISNTLQSFGWTNGILTGITETKRMVSRLAYADSPPAFSPFTINTLKPLIITWTIAFSF